MKRRIAFLLLLLPISLYAYAQGAKAPAQYNITKYERITNDPFKNVPGDKLVLDYYCTSGFSKANRFWYEIVIVDDRLTISFHSFEGANFRTVNYDRRDVKLPNAVVSQLVRALRAAGLKQKLDGIPVPETDAATREVLIARHKEIKIGGGRFNHTTYKAGTTQAAINKSVAEEHAANCSIDGDVDGMIAAIKKQFPALDSLMRVSKKG